jgi:hypothetical protein
VDGQVIPSHRPGGDFPRLRATRIAVMQWRALRPLGRDF